MDGRVVEFVDHLHEHFAEPTVVARARYQLPEPAGLRQMLRTSRAEFRFPDGAGVAQTRRSAEVRQARTTPMVSSTFAYGRMSPVAMTRARSIGAWWRRSKSNRVMWSTATSVGEEVADRRVDARVAVGAGVVLGSPSGRRVRPGSTVSTASSTSVTVSRPGVRFRKTRGASGCGAGRVGEVAVGDQHGRAVARLPQPLEDLGMDEPGREHRGPSLRRSTRPAQLATVGSPR